MKRDDYGFSMENPVRAAGFYGEKRYLECLRRIGSAETVRYDRLGSGCSETTGHPVDIYNIWTGGGLLKKRTQIYIDIYGEPDWRAPEGYELTEPAPEEGSGGPERADMDALFAAIRQLHQKIDQQ